MDIQSPGQGAHQIHSLSARRSPPPPLPHLNTTTMPPNGNSLAFPPELGTPVLPPGISPTATDATLPEPAPPSAASERGGAETDDEDSENDDEDTDDNHHEGGDDGASDNSAGWRWSPLLEDAPGSREPCEDEIKYIESREEHSAVEDEYWHNITFSAVKDPEINEVERGVIDWDIPAFNGTKQKPVPPDAMRSPVVRIGGYDWQIKFFPRGRRSDYPAVYLDCVTMKSPDFEGTEEFERPPLPFLDCQPRIKKRRSVAVQLCVVLYNPSEPRVYNFRTEAYQFHGKAADIGWKYFTSHPRQELAMRQHGMRKALVTDDKLAFRAYIRVLNDPTGCLWDNGLNNADEITQITGLRPFAKSHPYLAATLPLLHFSPFRDFVKGLRKTGCFTKYFQAILFKMFTRRRSSHFGANGTTLQADAMEILYRLRELWQKDCGDDEEAARKFNELVGEFHPERNYACGPNRLDTKTYPSIQEAVDHHPKLLATPQLLTLELTRHEHDKQDRKWKKITNRVKVPDNLQVSGRQYTLFAFVTHCGHLHSRRYNAYVRPHGFRQGWYAYHDGRVTRLTEKQALRKHSGGRDKPGMERTADNGYDSPYNEHHDRDGEVTYAVMYARNDVQLQSAEVQVESWLPEELRTFYEASLAKPPNSAVHEWPEHQAGGVPNADAQVLAENGEAAGHLAEFQDRINGMVGAATPEPPELIDGDGDVVMRNTEEASDYEIGEVAGDEEVIRRGIRDWLGRPFYEGDWKGVKYHGTGHYIHENGDDYVGEFRDNHMHGKGKIIFASTGDTYNGTWQLSQMHGKGTLVEKSTGNVFEGNFREGRKHGEFVLRGTVTDEDKSTCQICYDKPISTAFYDCGHVVACRDCAAQVDSCPMCRKRVVARLQLYGVRVTAS